MASVYTELYSGEPYLYKFDKSVLDLIENNTDLKLDREKRTVQLAKSKYTIHSVDWVLNKVKLLPSQVKKIDSQHILI